MKNMRMKSIFVPMMALILAVVMILSASSCSITMPYHTVTFMNGDVTVDVQRILDGGRPEFPDLNTKPSYQGVWICDDGSVFDADSRVHRDLTLRLMVEPIRFSISYDANGGALPEGNPEFMTVESATVALLAPTMDGASFLGWVDSEGLIYTRLGQLTYDIRLKARWKLLEYSITYDAGKGSMPDNPTKYTVKDKTVLLPSERVGYSFVGWFDTLGNRVDSLEGQLGKLLLIARWETDVYSVSLDYGDGIPVIYREFTVETGTFRLPAPEEEREGFTFVGWSDGEEIFTEISKGTVGNRSLVAVWEENL